MTYETTTENGKTITVEADTRKEAQTKIRARIPEGMPIGPVVPKGG